MKTVKSLNISAKTYTRIKHIFFITSFNKIYKFEFKTSLISHTRNTILIGELVWQEVDHYIVKTT
jgi:hypothetical protein